MRRRRQAREQARVGVGVEGGAGIGGTTGKKKREDGGGVLGRGRMSKVMKETNDNSLH